jgi:DNA modification methylase
LIYGPCLETPFLGIGSEVYAAVEMGRRGIGFELKPSYFKQAVKNLREAELRKSDASLLGLMEAS